jgi:hypothetical protein
MPPGNHPTSCGSQAGRDVRPGAARPGEGFYFDWDRIIILCTSNVKRIALLHSGSPWQRMALEDRTSRLTILIDPRKKAVFERLCAEEDATPSQVVRRLIRGYIEEKLGRPWRPEEEPAAEPSARRTSKQR